LPREFSVLRLQRSRAVPGCGPSCLLVLPPIGLILLAYRNAALSLFFAGACAIYLADQFAKHAYFLHTTVPVPAKVARDLRYLWRFRFLPLFNKPRGVEFYLLGFIAIGVAAIRWFDRLPRFRLGVFLDNLPAFLVAVGILLATPLVIEPFAAFLTSRPYIGPIRMVRHFLRAVVSWFSYNRRMTEYPGTFRSPGGICRARCWMAVATIVLFSSAVTPFFSRHRDRLTRELPQPYLDANTWELHIPTPPPDDSLWPWEKMNKRMYRREQIAQGEEVPFPELDKLFERETIPREMATLEPYQRAMLKRMTTEEREEFLREIFERKLASLPRREPGFHDHLLYVIEEEAIDSPKYRLTNYYFEIAKRFPVTVYFLVCVFLPPALLLSFLFAVSARSIAYVTEQFGAGLPTAVSEEDAYKTAAATISRIRGSDDKQEKDGLFLGVNAFDGTPVIVPRAVFKEHAHLLGDSGSGKTSLGMTSLISQLIEFGDSSLVVIDLKADDLALFEATREKAQEIDACLKEEEPDDEGVGYPFRWFTNELHHSTYVFNILQQSCLRSLTPYQRADILTAAMGLQYGTDYGRAFYAASNLELLHQALVKNPDIDSFSELAELLGDPRQLKMPNELRRAASQFHAVVSRLASCEAIDGGPPDRLTPDVHENAIDLVDVFKKPQVLYFHLPSLIGTTSSAEIARFVVHMLLASSKAVGPKRKQVYLFIDEFQRITAGNLDIILQTARSMNVGVILANQTMSDLKAPGVDLISTIEANTRFRQIFAASDLAALRQIVESSGETIIHNRSWSQYLGSIGVMAGGLSRAFTETISPRLRANDVILASDHPLQSIVYVRRGKDYAQYGGFPFVMTSSYLTSQEVYDKRREADWPEAQPGTICPDAPPLRKVPMDQAPELPGEGPDPVLGPPAYSPADDGEGPDQTDAAETSNDTSEIEADEQDSPFYEKWKELEERRRRQRRRGRPQNKYPKDDTTSSSEQDPTP
jgi:type IV secretory system conjugative DNA transfer VirD4/TraG family protein